MAPCEEVRENLDRIYVVSQSRFRHLEFLASLHTQHTTYRTRKLEVQAFEEHFRNFSLTFKLAESNYFEIYI